MDAGTITEAQFLLTELQYTLGQLHVQLADMDVDMREPVQSGNRTIGQILSDLGESERSYQHQYARLLSLRQPSGESGDDVALPLSADEKASGPQGEFEQLRTQTIGLLQGTEAGWTQEVLDLVKQQVAHDREQTTQIAECRTSAHEQDTRSDLEEPLTTAPRPHALAEETGSHLEPGDEAASSTSPQ